MEGKKNVGLNVSVLAIKETCNKWHIFNQSSNRCRKILFNHFQNKLNLQKLKFSIEFYQNAL